MKVLITGSAGLVGSAATKLFKEKGWEVVGVDNNMRYKLFGTKEQDLDDHVKLDIRDEGAVYQLFEKHTFDAIIHTAGQPSHDYSMQNPLVDFYINVVGTVNLLEATRRFAPNATFIFTSTDRVYGGNLVREMQETDTRYHSDTPFTEKLSIDQAPHCPFGAAKVAADTYVQEYGYQYGIKTACFRCGCITGKNHQGSTLHGFLSYLAKCIKENKTYTIFGYKGKQVRDQIHADDLAAAFYEFIQAPKVAAVYNMGGGPERSVSILEAADLISKKVDKPFLHEYVDEPRKSDICWHVHDVSKFKKDYPEWDYQYSLDDIINDVTL